MSELKEIMLVNQVSGERIPSGTYKKAEVDNVIAELKQKLNEAQTELELWRDGSIISESHQKELDEKHHSYYKRCLAMTQEWRNYAAFCGMQSHCNNHRGLGNTADKWTCKEIHAWKCRNRWLKIAEQFKETK